MSHHAPPYGDSKALIRISFRLVRVFGGRAFWNDGIHGKH